ncbi:MAG: hypothetical protein IT379_37355 [Deltaproteobacteria bacterium]|nr:hypothetical protein [Deltaproteobacteria bacterium]
MNSKKRPAIKISAKHRETKERLDIGAAWLGDDGRLHGLRLADGVKIRLADGTVIDAAACGKDGSFWLDIFVNEIVRPASQPGEGSRGGGTKHHDDFAPEDFSDQDIGF